MNWRVDNPYMGRRDLFMTSRRGGDNAVDFIRHEFWLHKLLKMQAVMLSNCSSWSFKRAFKKEEAVKA